MNRNVGIRGIISPPKSPAEIKEDVRADAEAMAAVVRKIGPIERHTSTMNPDDFGNINSLQAADKPIKEVRPAEKKDKKFRYESWAGNKEPGKLQKHRGAMKWIVRPKRSVFDFYDSPEGVDFITKNMDGISKEEADKLNKSMKSKLPKKVETENKKTAVEADELKKAEMLVSKANAKTVKQLTDLKNFGKNPHTAAPAKDTQLMWHGVKEGFKRV